MAPSALPGRPHCRHRVKCPVRTARPRCRPECIGILYLLMIEGLESDGNRWVKDYKAFLSAKFQPFRHVLLSFRLHRPYRTQSKIRGLAMDQNHPLAACDSARCDVRCCKRRRAGLRTGVKAVARFYERYRLPLYGFACPAESKSAVFNGTRCTS